MKIIVVIRGYSGYFTIFHNLRNFVVDFHPFFVLRLVLIVINYFLKIYSYLKYVQNQIINDYDIRQQDINALHKNKT